MLTESIPASLAGERLDRVVALVADVSRAVAAVLVEVGGVTVDGEPALSGKVKVVEGQEVGIDPSLIPRPQLPIADPDVHVHVVYSDDQVIVVDKPAGLIVHPGAGNPRGTLINGLLVDFPEIANVGDPMRPGVVHRLDAGTTGLMMVARTTVAYEALVGMLSRREVGRRYAALVWGHPAQQSGIIDAPIGRDHRDPTKMAVVVDGKHARTRYEVAERFTSPREVALVTGTLETGRTHQIRVHLESIGHPVVGDATYGGARSALAAPRPMLHAEHLEFVHPVSGRALSFDAPIPDDMRAVIDRCGTD
ncbi:MAG: RluA family pseudouridine synthase [Ilumatobacteraceae bacterium]